MVLLTAGQSRFSLALETMKAWLPFLGYIHNIEGTIKNCVPNLGRGWKASTSSAVDGALCDMRWHFLDMITAPYLKSCYISSNPSNPFNPPPPLIHSQPKQISLDFHFLILIFPIK